MANIYTDIKLFDAEYYLANNPDVAAAIEGTDITAQDHYFLHGAAENLNGGAENGSRAPNSWFNAAEYVAQNPDLADVDANLLLAHFALHGMAEGRAPNAATAGEDGKIKSELLADYVNAEGNEDVKDAIAEITGTPVGAELTAEQAAIAIQHFFNYGINEDRKGGLADVIAEGEGEGEGLTKTFTLTEGRDTLTGTSGDDTFLGFVGQNQDGTLTNALSTGDYIDGGAGRDTIKATVIQDQTATGLLPLSAINVRTENVEVAEFEALKSSSFFFGGSVGDAPVDVLNLLGVNTVQVDAGRMNSVEEFWSDNSSADLLITDVRLGDKLSITKDVTFGLRETDFDTSFVALFDSQSLRAAPDTTLNSQLLVRIADVSTETPATPLANVNLNLSFNLGDETIGLMNIQSTDGSYAGLVVALQAALAEAGYANVDVALSEPYNQVTVAGNTVTLPFVAQEILLTDPDGNEFSNVDFTYSAIEPVPDGFLVAGNAAPVDPTEISSLIESNLILDDAGRGSLAGDVLIGGMSNSQKGVEKFNVTVDRDSKIESLYTTAGKLQEIQIDSMGANGDLWIGGTQAGLSEINANAFAGSALSLGQGDTGYGGGDDAIENLANLNASETAAAITFVAEYDGNGRASSEQAFAINTGTGDDIITADVVGTSTSGSTTASLLVNSAGGNNTVELSSTNVEVNNATVTLGSGDDIVTGGMTQLSAYTGAGNDTVYAENTGIKANLIVDVADGILAGGAASDVQFLYGRQVQVTLATAGVAADGTVQGFESALIDIAQGGARLTTVDDLNDAILRAINDDPVLSKIATASVDSNKVVSVQYLVDGLQEAASVEVAFFGDEWADLSTAEQNAIQSAYRELVEDSTTNVQALYDAAVDVDVTTVASVVGTTLGTDSLTNTVENLVNAGLDNDVIVLSSESAMSDTIEFDAGGFGNDTVVHFTAGTVGGADVLDFTDWLDNEVSSSGSVASQSRVATTLNSDNIVEVNSVTVLDFTDFTFASGVTFDSLSTANAGAGINLQLDATGAVTNLVGNQKSLLFIENDQNEGEYKVFEMTSANTADTGLAVTLVGSIDFGETQAFDVLNFA